MERDRRGERKPRGANKLVDEGGSGERTFAVWYEPSAPGRAEGGHPAWGMHPRHGEPRRLRARRAPPGARSKVAPAGRRPVVSRRRVCTRRVEPRQGRPRGQPTGAPDLSGLSAGLSPRDPPCGRRGRGWEAKEPPRCWTGGAPGTCSRPGARARDHWKVRLTAVEKFDVGLPPAVSRDQYWKKRVSPAMAVEEPVGPGMAVRSTGKLTAPPPSEV